MHLHIGFMEFVTFTAYYLLLKALLQFINLEARRNGKTIPAGVSGLFA